MPLVIREDRAGLTTLTLNRPEKLNSLNVALFAELRAHVEAIAAQTEQVALVVVRGAGKCFSAGHDLADIAVGEKPPKPSFQADTIELLANLPQPVISAVHGHCYTGALELALAGDLLLAADNAKFADTHAKWALTPVWGMSQRLPRRVGQAKSAEMMFTAKTYTAQEAVAMNLANFCVPLADFDAEIDKLAQMILANSSFSHRANKALLKETDGMALPAGLSSEIHRSKGRGPDMQERSAAFRNKTATVS